ncbi:MAG: 4-hydroxy-tetrahydrodipicolinate synthase [Bacillati bacterium ANGP1]|uniref:4-hydroxy-tetrahydrodipicolinate synthase n=1 Tax=Candidatus Segetimicrobium genomatis TaxID=2569760 RepID=A0A537M595_9BACT|nr:MAG: 4-hydroxy-tetrahydrodipicolinate synthase [Terrabacteria group bacterium ANGP1]
MNLDSRQLRGSYPPLITPFKGGAVDYETYARLIEFQIAEGSHGIVVNGTTSEPSTLTAEERARLVRVAVETSRRRIPVVAATGSQSHAETVWLTEQAEAAGADAVLVVTPYYIRPPQRGLVEYFVDVGRRTALPFLIYHIPGRTAVSVELETMERIGFVSQLLDRFGPEFRVFVGLEELSFPMLAVGATGLMNAVGNLAPRKLARLCDAVASGALGEARALHYELFELNRAVFWDTNPIPIKYMMKRLGLIAANEHRLPMVPADRGLEARLDAVLSRARLDPVPRLVEAAEGPEPQLMRQRTERETR